MATIQPTPQRPNPTTESEETSLITNQEPVDPRPQQANTEFRESTTNETTTNFPTQSSQGIGIVIIIIIVTVSVVTVVIVTAILLKKCHAVSTATDRAYGLDTHQGREETKYKGPEMNVDDTKQNVTYIITNTVEMNEVHGTRIVTEGKEAYATSIITEGNQAYTSSIATDRNAAYGQVTSGSVYEIID